MIFYLENIYKIALTNEIDSDILFIGVSTLPY